MSLNIIAHPHGREAIPLITPDNDPPEFSEAVPGGYRRASFSAVLKDGWRERLLDAPVYFYAPSGMVWAGRVWSISKPIGGVSKIRCNGWQNALTRNRRGVIYSDTSLMRFNDYNGTNYGAFTRSVDINGIEIAQIPSTTADIGDKAGYIWWHPELTVHSIAFDVEVNHADVSFGIYESATEGALTAGTAYTSSASGQSQAINGKHGFVIYLQSDISGSNPSDTDKYGRIDDLVVYGTADTSVTPYDVIIDSLAQLPADDIPAGDEYRAWVDADATVVQPLVFSTRTSEADHIAEALRYTTKDFGFWAKRVNGEFAPVPVFAAKPSTAAYVAFVDGENITARLGGDDLTELASDVRVHHYDDLGRSDSVDRADSDTSHYLVAIDRDKVESIYAETSSTTLANTIGDGYIIDYGEMQISGTIDVLGAIKDENGADVLPCEITAGKRIRLLSMEEGSVEARIVQVEKTDMFRARLHVSTRPYMLDVELARLTKHMIAG